MRRKLYVPAVAGIVNVSVADVRPTTGAVFVPFRYW
jgi:hypothetical protein